MILDMAFSPGGSAEQLIPELVWSPERILSLKTEFEISGAVTLGPPCLNERSFDQMVCEARQQRASAWLCERSGDDGQSCAQRNWRAELGPASRALLSSEEFQRIIYEITGTWFEPSFEASCFTYYESSLDFLSVHQDRPESCALSVLIYLESSQADTSPPGDGLGLFISTRNKPPSDTGTLLRVTARPNRAVILRGAELPHYRPHLSPGESISLLSACLAPCKANTETLEPSLLSPRDSDYGSALKGQVGLYVYEGFQAWESGDFKSSQALFEKSLSLSPDNVGAWSGLGHALWSLREFQSSWWAFAEACKRDSWCAGHWSNVGLALRDLGHGEQAIQAFGVAIMLDPDCAPAFNEWANVLLDQGSFEAALPLYLKSLSLDATRAVVHHNLGVCYNCLGERESALECFRTALSLDSNYSHSLKELEIMGITHSA